MRLTNTFKTHFVTTATGNRVDIDPGVCSGRDDFHPMISVIEIASGATQKHIVTVHQSFGLSAEQSRKFGLVIEAAGRLCASAEDYGSLQRAWFYSFCKPRLVAVNNQSNAVH